MGNHDSFLETRTRDASIEKPAALSIGPWRTNATLMKAGTTGPALFYLLAIS